MQLHQKSGSPALSQEAIEGENPHHQVSLRSSMDLPYHLQLDVTGRYVDELTARQIPAYVALDVRLGWRPTQNLELALVGQNMFDNHHPEFRTPNFVQTQPTEVPRSVYLQATFRF
jgi:iron complex outermembrane recepter protein